MLYTHDTLCGKENEPHTESPTLSYSKSHVVSVFVSLSRTIFFPHVTRYAHSIRLRSTRNAMYTCANHSRIYIHSDSQYQSSTTIYWHRFIHVHTHIAIYRNDRHELWLIRPVNQLCTVVLNNWNTTLINRNFSFSNQMNIQHWNDSTGDFSVYCCCFCLFFGFLSLCSRYFDGSTNELRLVYIAGKEHIMDDIYVDNDEFDRIMLRFVTHVQDFAQVRKKIHLSVSSYNHHCDYVICNG